MRYAIVTSDGVPHKLPILAIGETPKDDVVYFPGKGKETNADQGKEHYKDEYFYT